MIFGKEVELRKVQPEAGRTVYRGTLLRDVHVNDIISLALDDDKHLFKSSRIVSIQPSDGYLTITTKNSTYELREII